MRLVPASVDVARNGEDAEVDVLVGVVLGERVAGIVDVDAVMSVLVRVVLDQQVTARSSARVDSIERVRAELVVLQDAVVGVEEVDPDMVLEHLVSC